jgi:hypothetical protein
MLFSAVLLLLASGVSLATPLSSPPTRRSSALVSRNDVSPSTHVSPDVIVCSRSQAPRDSAINHCPNQDLTFNVPSGVVVTVGDLNHAFIALCATGGIA